MGKRNNNSSSQNNTLFSYNFKLSKIGSGAGEHQEEKIGDSGKIEDNMSKEQCDNHSRTGEEMVDSNLRKIPGGDLYSKLGVHYTNSGHSYNCLKFSLSTHTLQIMRDHCKRCYEDLKNSNRIRAANNRAKLNAKESEAKEQATSAPNFLCSCRGCGKAFYTEPLLKAHVFDHEGKVVLRNKWHKLDGLLLTFLLNLI